MVLHMGTVGESVEWNVGIEVGKASRSSEFESDDGLADFVDKMGGLNRHQKREVPSVLLTPEDHHLMSLHCPSVVSQSVDLGQNNNPNTTPTKDYEIV